MAVQSSDRQNRPAPISLRLTDAERALLEAQATGGNLSAFIRRRLFAPTEQSARREVRNPRVDERQIAQLLGYLGSSDIAQSLRKLSVAATSGALPCSPETEQLLSDCCSSIIELRQVLMNALGLSERESRP